MNVPSVGYSRLKNTALIQVVGKDANKFLNGLITSKFTGTNTEQYANDCLINDNSYYINKSNYLDNSENHGYKKVGQYSLCLNATGKLFSDLWVYPFQFFNKKIETAPFFEKDYVYDQNYLIEVNGTVAKQLYALFKTHKLASKVRLKHLRDDMFSSWYFYNDVDPYFTEQLWKFKQNWLKNNRLLSDPETAQNLLLEFVDSKQLFSSNDIDYLSQHLYGLAFDERSPSRLGLKLLTSHDVSPLRLLDPSKLAKDPSSFKKVSSEQLRSRRILNDLAEVSISELEPNKYLPLELNYNLMGIVNGGYDEQYEDYLAKLDEQEELAENDENYTKEEISEVKYNLDNSPVISFNKGCYIGQELTHRTFFRGVIRKRVLPLKLSLSNDESVLDNEALVTKILAAGIDDKHVYYEEHVPKGEAEENVKQDQTLSSNNPFGSSTPRRRKKPYVGALLHIQGNFAVGTINLPEYTKAHREFFIKVKISDPIKKSLSEEEIKSLSIVNNEIRLYIEGFVPEWFPEGWLDELD